MKSKKIVTLLLCLTLLVSTMFFPQSADASQNITVTLNVSMYGTLIDEAAFVPVSLDGKESYTLDDVFKEAHTLYYDGENGYSSENGDFGKYITKFWGDESENFGYQVNGGDKYVGGLETYVENGDIVDVAIYENKYPETEIYTKFDSFKQVACIGEEIEITLYQAGYDENWNMVFSPCEGATVIAGGAEYVTGADGKIFLTFYESGNHIISARKSKIVSDKEVSAITAPVCKVTVADSSMIMDNIADKYSSDLIATDGNMVWLLADLMVYNRLFPEKEKVLSEDIQKKCIDKIVSDALSSDKPNALAKSILALRALGFDARQIHDENFKKHDLVARLTALIDEKSDSVTDTYTIPYVLLALNQGEDYLTQAQSDYLLSEIIANKSSWQENEWGTDALSAILFAIAPFADENEDIKNLADESLQILKNAQSETGAIGNAASTGLAMVAFSALGIDSSEVASGGKTLGCGLLSQCAENLGGFEPMQNSFSTEQGFRGLLAWELLKNNQGIMYDFYENPMNPLWADYTPDGCPVVFSSDAPETEIEISDFSPFEEGKYDLGEGTYTYSASAKGYKTYTDTFTVSTDEAEQHILKEISFSLEKKSSNSGGGGGGYHLPTAQTEKKEETSDNTAVTNENTEIPKESVRQDKEFSENTFTDVKASDWYYDSVKYVYQNNLMQGTENGFDPDGKMTRAMLVTVLFRMENAEAVAYENKFSDIAKDAWYSDSVMWASKNKLVSGLSEDIFSPNENITREQMAVIIYRYALYKGYGALIDADFTKYSDSEKISPWAYDALRWANGANIISGTSDNEISPKNTATRSQVATILMRFCEELAK